MHQEFPVAVAATTRKPHYLTASEQQRLEACAPVYLSKAQVDLGNGIVQLPESKTVNGIADMPMSERAREAFVPQMTESGDSEYLFPSPFEGGKTPHSTTVRKLWDRTLKRAGLPHFSLYELRHTFATRLSAGASRIIS